MSNYKTHIAGGVVVWLFSLGLFWHQFNTFGTEQFFIFALTSFFICFLGSLLPDADTPKSKIGGLLQATVLATAILFGATKYFQNFNNPVNSLINTVIVAVSIFAIFVLIRPRHRGATHTLKANIAYALLVFLFFFLGGSLYHSAFFGIIAFLSYFSHLALDRQVVFG